MLYKILIFLLIIILILIIVNIINIFNQKIIYKGGGDSPLFAAIKKNNFESVKKILNSGANRPNLLSITCSNLLRGEVKDVDESVDESVDEDGNTALAAAHLCMLEKVSEFQIDQCINIIDKESEFIKNNIQIISLLLEKGYSPNCYIIIDGPYKLMPLIIAQVTISMNIMDTTNLNKVLNRLEMDTEEYIRCIFYNFEIMIDFIYLIPIECKKKGNPVDKKNLENRAKTGILIFTLFIKYNNSYNNKLLLHICRYTFEEEIIYEEKEDSDADAGADSDAGAGADSDADAGADSDAGAGADSDAGANSDIIKIQFINNLVSLLLENGADVNVENDNGDTPLFMACSKQKPNIALVSLLLENGANINVEDGYGDTPLLMACSKQKPDIALVSLLLENGANINVENNDKDTSLLMACSKQKPDIDLVTLLLNKGANVNAKNRDEDTPLLNVSNTTLYDGENPDIALVTLLLERGANVNVKDKYNNTPLLNVLNSTRLFEKNPNIALVTLLLKNGADVNIKNQFNDTPLLYAKNDKNKELQELLKTYNTKD